MRADINADGGQCCFADGPLDRYSVIACPSFDESHSAFGAHCFSQAPDDEYEISVNPWCQGWVNESLIGAVFLGLGG